MSDDFKLTDTFRKVFLAGVGAVAVSAEKSKALIDTLVEKGEITVEQGKVLNQELKHKIDSATDSIKTKAQANADAMRAAAAVPKGNDFSAMLNKLTPEQMEALKEQLAAKQADTETDAADSTAAKTDDSANASGETASEETEKA
ncbi:MAG: phasin family protein [Bilifractor sp.]